ncbi:arsenic resistance N-acetyltransferase ArsN2 [Haloarcula litorea]|uniref:arsenic resistance N-acetyltransferase ArsN2 n=1 Tax=Haloarcula litorea TaxID=3032579 RepID=UPI0023E7E290|nr:arsenic resistance N-acetyltransferase ArsN2 [Halomicroarcula sp. GDY20]
MTATPELTVERADADTVGRVERLLEESGLPSSDVRDAPERFRLAVAEGDLVAVGGLRVEGSDALLRSLAVPEAYRGEGYGSALCAHLERAARREGVERLYLLTTTAAAFFRARGYDPVERERVPPSIRATSQFADLCPATATCLVRPLD